jgi:hypothetical protein
MIEFFKRMFCNHSYKFIKDIEVFEEREDTRFLLTKRVYICEKCLERKRIIL